MLDSDCVAFLQWALPRLGYRWPGFRKVRRQVCKRIKRRLQELDLADLEAYRQYLATRPEEWARLDTCCGITISRFGRDREVFRRLMTDILPALARRQLAEGQAAIRIWSAGCGAGEEPYSLTVLAEDTDLSGMALSITATDSNSHQIERARATVYPGSSLRELSPAVRREAFELIDNDTYRLRDPYRRAVSFSVQDIRQELPAGPFDLILLRNLAFTYFDLELQRQTLIAVVAKLAPGGFLVVGSHEQLPEALPSLPPLTRCKCILGPLSTASAPDAPCDNRE
jgi:chemotaxis protein methyltransferase CheR